MEILKIEGLCKQYPAFSLKNVTFSMESGTVMGFIGRNGAGKTTTLKSMLRLVHPDAGHVEICGMDAAEQELAVKAQIGFVTGSAAYYPRKRLAQLTAATRRFYPNWDEARYQDCLRRFALDEGKRVSELSEGMKVKYQLALAMSHHAKLLILDEPTSGLDPAARTACWGCFWSWWSGTARRCCFQRTSRLISTPAPTRSRTSGTVKFLRARRGGPSRSAIAICGRTRLRSHRSWPRS